jgi:hypothetical protein
MAIALMLPPICHDSLHQTMELYGLRADRFNPNKEVLSNNHLSEQSLPIIIRR